MQNYNISEYNNFNSESIAYENMISDYFLAWGESSSRIIEKFAGKNKAIIVGNPNFGKIIKKKTSKFNPKICTIFLSYNIYDKNNYEMIKIVSEFAKKHLEVKFYFKMHPDNDENNYKNKIFGKNIQLLDKKSDKNEYLVKSDFLIMHNTTTAIEALSYQIPVYRFKDKDFAEMPIPQWNFTDVKSLDKLFLRMFNQKEFKKYLKEAYDSYSKIFYQPAEGVPKHFMKSVLAKIQNKSIAYPYKD